MLMSPLSLSLKGDKTFLISRNTYLFFPVLFYFFSFHLIIYSLILDFSILGCVWVSFVGGRIMSCAFLVRSGGQKRA